MYAAQPMYDLMRRERQQIRTWERTSYGQERVDYYYDN